MTGEAADHTLQGKQSKQSISCAMAALFLWHRKLNYRKFPKYSDTPKNCCNHPKSWTRWLYFRVTLPKDAEGIANSVDPDQTAPLGAVWSGSTLFAQAYVSENLGSLR